MYNDGQTYLAKNLKHFRQKYNYSQEELAKLADVTRASLGSWERGASVPRQEKVNRLAKAMQCSPKELVYKDLATGAIDVDAINTALAGEPLAELIAQLKAVDETLKEANRIQQKAWQMLDDALK